MSLSVGDRLEIHEVIALHGHLCDAGSYDRFDEVFTSDLEVDVSDLGLRPVPADDSFQSRLDAYIAVAHRRAPGSVLAMHVTNVVVGEDGDGARAWSKGLTVNQDGSVASFTYEDQFVRTGQAGGSGVGKSPLGASPEAGSSHSCCPPERRGSALTFR